MAMKPCKKCTKNDWDYVKLDNDPHIYCTCNNCGFKFNFVIPKKLCSSCQKPTDFERLHNEKEDWRGKKCLLCGFVKKMPIAHARFKTINGISYRLEEDDLWHEVVASEYWEKGKPFLILEATQNIAAI